MGFKYDVVAVGGTFDFFHKGHIQLLSKCFEIGKTVIIGITSDNLAKGKNHQVLPLEERKKSLISFLKNNGFLNRARIIILEDSYGPTISSKNISAIVVSEETMIRAIEINKIRKGRNLSPLDILVISMIKDRDKRPFSSTKLRRNERNFIKFLESNQSYNFIKS